MDSFSLQFKLKTIGDIFCM